MAPSASSVKPVMRRALRIFLLIGLFMTMAGVGAYVALTLIIKGEEPVVVPDLVGKDILYGLEILSDLGLNTRVRGTVYHATVPKNHVIDQDPEPGASIKRGRDVKVRVSRGPERIPMPNLRGLSLQQSNVLLTENGLCQGVVSAMANSRYTNGQVMAQHPQPGATVARNACVDLLVSQGQRTRSFPMPTLTGWSLGKTASRLEALQLKMGRIRSEETADVPPDSIVEQSILPGYRVSEGESVELAVRRQKGHPFAGKQPHGDQLRLFRFALENGFLKKRVQVTIERQQLPIHLFDDFISPGREIWLLISKDDTSTLRVVVDGQRISNPWEPFSN